MKIAIVTDYHNKSGIGKQNYQLYRALGDLWHEVEIIHLVSPQGFKEAPLYGTNFVSKSFALGVFWSFRRSLSRHFASNRYDVVLLWHQGLAYLLPTLLKSGIPHAVTVMDLFTLYPEYSVSWHPKFFVFNRLMLAKVADFENVAFISDFSRRDFVKFFKKSPLRTAVIPIGIPLNPEWSGSYDVSEWSEYFQGKKAVLQVWSSDPRKNPTTFFDAAREFLKRPGSSDTVFVRVWNTSDSLKALAPENVAFLSNLSEERLSSLYSYSSAFVFTSVHEGYGMPIVEARTKSLPVISSKVSDMEELLRGDVGTRFVEDPHDFREFDRLIAETLESGPDKIPFSEAASLDTVAEARKYLDFFASFIPHDA